MWHAGLMGGGDDWYNIVLVTAPVGSEIEFDDGDEVVTAIGTGSQQAIAIHDPSSTYNITVSVNGYQKTDTVTSTAVSGTVFIKNFKFAKITLTFDDDFRGLAVTLTDGTHVASPAPTLPATGNTADFYVPYYEVTYTFSATVSGIPYTSKGVYVDSLDDECTETLNVRPDGKTVTPTDDIQTWLECAGIDKPYTTLDEVLGDHESLQILMTDHNAVDYMVRSTTWATDVCADETAMRYIGRRNYAADTLLADEDWFNAIVNSEYVNFVLNVSVPTMTGPTSPSGEASSSSSYGGNNVAYKAFDKNTGTNWAPSNASGSSWLQYAFDNSIKCYFIKYCFTDSTIASRITSAKFQASNSPDFSNPVDLTDVITSFTAGSYVSIKSKNNLAYKYFRFVINNATNYPNTAELDFIGRQDVDETKVMLYGANQDSFYYKDSSQQDVPLTTLSTTEKEISKSDLPLGEFKLYSSVAKNPDDLTADFCKTFKNDDNLIEVMMRPENALYWYGYNKGEIEVCSTANGWTAFGNYSFVSPSFNTQNIIVDSQGNSKQCGISSKNKLNANNYYSVIEGQSSGQSKAGDFRYYGNKNMGSGGTVIGTANIDATGTKKYTVQNQTQTEGYITVKNDDGYKAKVEALWYNNPNPACNLFSAAKDIVYYTENGVDIVVAETDEFGGAIVDFSKIPAGVTLYSSIAKDPDDPNLADPYSKTFSPVNGRFWLMPDNTLYWYGYMSDDLEIVSAANGWTSNGTIPNPVFETNDVLCNYTSSWIHVGIAAKGLQNNIQKFKAIVQGTALGNSTSTYSYLIASRSKNLANNADTINAVSNNSNSMTLIEMDTSTYSDFYLCHVSANSANKQYALWYE